MENKFLTIRQTAATGILTENRLRKLVKEGKIPGVYTGRRFLVNYNKLLDFLDEESKSKTNLGGN